MLKLNIVASSWLTLFAYLVQELAEHKAERFVREDKQIALAVSCLHIGRVVVLY